MTRLLSVAWGSSWMRVQLVLLLRVWQLFAVDYSQNITARLET